MTVRYTELMTARRSLIMWATSVAMAGAFYLVTTPSAAEEAAEASSREEAVRHHFRGRELFQAGEYAEAVTEFEAAQRLAPAPSNLFNLARCYLRLGRIDDALEAIESFLAQDIPDERRREGEAMQIALRDMAEGVATSEPLDEDPITAEPMETPLEPSTTPDEPSITEPEDPDEPEPAPTFPRGTGAIGFFAGASVPLGEENIGASAALVGELGGGLLLGRGRELSRYGSRLIRLELFAEVHLQPHTTGYLLQIGGGPRVAIGFGGLPLWLEVAIGVGAVGLQVDEGSERQIADGSYWSLMIVPSVALTWQPIRWLEVVVRPIRVELIGLTGDFPDDFSARWSLDVGIRFRM